MPWRNSTEQHTVASSAGNCKGCCPANTQKKKIGNIKTPRKKHPKKKQATTSKWPHPR